MSVTRRRSIAIEPDAASAIASTPGNRSVRLAEPRAPSPWTHSRPWSPGNFAASLNTAGCRLEPLAEAVAVSAYASSTAPPRSAAIEAAGTVTLRERACARRAGMRHRRTPRSAAAPSPGRSSSRCRRTPAATNDAIINAASRREPRLERSLEVEQRQRQEESSPAARGGGSDRTGRARTRTRCPRESPAPLAREVSA